MLIVDDDADTRELLAEFCAAKGFRVATAQDGRAATMALERARPPFPVVDRRSASAARGWLRGARRRSPGQRVVLRDHDHRLRHHRQRRCGPCGPAPTTFSPSPSRSASSRSCSRAFAIAWRSKVENRDAHASDRRRPTRPTPAASVACTIGCALLEDRVAALERRARASSLGDAVRRFARSRARLGAARLQELGRSASRIRLGQRAARPNSAAPTVRIRDRSSTVRDAVGRSASLSNVLRRSS